MIKRRYKFNIIDHLHYMIGQDRLHNVMPKWQFSPLDAAIAVFIMWPMLGLCLIMPNDEMQIAWLVITVSAYLYGEHDGKNPVSLLRGREPTTVAIPTEKIIAVYGCL